MRKSDWSPTQGFGLLGVVVYTVLLFGVGIVLPFIVAAYLAQFLTWLF